MVEDRGDDWLIVGVGGLGILVQVPATTADGASNGTSADLHTYLHVREDALQLFGFSAREELRLFEQLIGVSGVGPRAALGLLSAMEYPRLAAAIVSGDTDSLRRVPGIGQKTAERLVLELRDKVTPPETEAAPSVVRGRQADAELVAALVALGYSQAEASGAAAALPEDGDQPLEERIRRALAYFSG